MPSGQFEELTLVYSGAPTSSRRAKRVFMAMVSPLCRKQNILTTILLFKLSNLTLTISKGPETNPLKRQLTWAYGNAKGWPWTPLRIARARHALHLYALQAATPETVLELFQEWPPAEHPAACSLRPSSIPLDTPRCTPLTLRRLIHGVVITSKRSKDLLVTRIFSNR
jgi:hypothetical protein